MSDPTGSRMTYRRNRICSLSRTSRLQWGIALSVIASITLFLLLREIFAGRLLLDPIAFAIGPLEVRWYGLIIALAILIALPWTLQRVETRDLDRAAAEGAYWWAVLGGIVGARLIYVLQNLEYFTAHLDRVVALTDGGLSIHGALLGGALALWTAVRFDGKRFLQLADAAVPAVLLGMILGRLGNFANAELFGPPTDLPWQIFIPETARPEGFADIVFYHPTFLYDLILNTVVLMLLLRFERTIKRPGQLTLWFFLGIAITRFIVEFWRLGDSLVGGFSLAQLVSICIILGSFTLLKRNYQG